MPPKSADTGRFQTAERSPMTVEQAVWMHPRVMSGSLCFRDTRILVSTLFNFIARGQTIENYLDVFDVHRDAFAAVMLAAGRLACEAAESQLPPEPANSSACQRSYPQLPETPEDSPRSLHQADIEGTHIPSKPADTGRFKTAEDSPMPIEQAVWIHPEVMSGSLCFRDTRILVSSLFIFLAEGKTIDEYLNDFDVRPHAFAAVMLAAGRLACEAAKSQLPPEPASIKARRRSYPQLPAHTHPRQPS